MLPRQVSYRELTEDEAAMLGEVYSPSGFDFFTSVIIVNELSFIALLAFMKVFLSPLALAVSCAAFVDAIFRIYKALQRRKDFRTDIQRGRAEIVEGAVESIRSRDWGMTKTSPENKEFYIQVAQTKVLFNPRLCEGFIVLRIGSFVRVEYLPNTKWGVSIQYAPGLGISEENWRRI